MPYVAKVKLRFVSPCLGNVWQEDPEPNLMRKDASGKVVFSPRWWSGMLCEAARIYGKHHGRAKEVVWPMHVDGELGEYERPYFKKGGERMLKRHEAFAEGSEVEVAPIVPSDLPLEEFKALLETAGKYVGISPFGWKRAYGRFEVEEVDVRG